MAIKVSRAFGTQKAYKAHLVRGKGGVAGEVADLRSDVDDGFIALEAATGAPLVEFVDGTNTFSAGTPGTHILVGTDFLQGKVQGVLASGAGTSEVTFTAVRPGTDGNDIRVKMTDTGSLSTSVTGNDITVTYNGGVTTADQIATDVNADTDALKLVNCVGGGSGTAQVEILTLTNLAGGTGEGATQFDVVAGGLSQEVTIVSDTSITFTSDNTGTILANGDLVNVVVISDDVRSNSISMAVVA